MTDQIRRSSRSVGANMPEAWRNGVRKTFHLATYDADGEQQETQHWIDTAVDCGYWKK